MSDQRVNGELSAEAILAADDLPLLRVNVPEWGGHVYVATLRGADREIIERQLASNPRLDKRAAWCSMLIVDSLGVPVFKHDQQHKLGQKSGVVLDRIIDAAVSHNKLSKEAEEELLGNS